MKIFVAAPFESNLKNGLLDKEKREFIQKIIGLLEEQGHKIYNAHRREAYGAKWMSANECTPLDFEQISKSKVLIAIPGKSGGVHIELGWASAMSKRIILLLEAGIQYSNLVIGLNKVTSVEVIKYNTTEGAIQDLKQKFLN